MKIVFMGTPIFAKNILQKLVEAKKYDVVAVYTKEDAVRGRGKKLEPSPVKEFAIQNNIEVQTPKNFKCESEVEKLKAYEPDFICVAAYGIILPKAVLDVPKYACLNVHGSILPKWRGAAPVQRAILNGDEKTGTTIMQMDEGMDTGAYSLQSEIEIGNKNCEEIFEELSRIGEKDLEYVLDNFSEGIKWTSQDETKVSYAGKLDKRELWLDDAESGQTSLNKVKASSSESPAKCCIAGKNVTVIDAEIQNGEFKITKLKPDGKNVMD